MRKLIKCKICDHVYSPKAHAYHCPLCGTMFTQVNGKCYIEKADTVIEIARGLRLGLKRIGEIVS